EEKERAQAPGGGGRGHLQVAAEQVHVRRDAGRVYVPARGHGPRRADFVPLLARGNREGVVQDRDGAVALVDRALGEVQRGPRAVRASLRAAVVVVHLEDDGGAGGKQPGHAVRLLAWPDARSPSPQTAGGAG